MFLAYIHNKDLHISNNNLLSSLKDQKMRELLITFSGQWMLEREEERMNSCNLVPLGVISLNFHKKIVNLGNLFNNSCD